MKRLLHALQNKAAKTERLSTLLVLGLLTMLLAGCGALNNVVAGPTITPAPPGGTILEPPRNLPDFTLTAQTGNPLNLSDLRGKPVLMAFGYTHCPDVCPVTLAQFNQIARALGEDAGRVAFVFVSVDGQRDTPERLAQYLRTFNPNFIGLTGDPETVRLVGTDYGVYFEYEEVAASQADYLVAHTTSWFLVDPEGRLRIIYAYGTPPEIVTTDIRAMLAQDESAL